MAKIDVDAGVVRAERFEVIDSKGRTRVWLTTDPVNHAPYFYMLDENEIERIGLVLDDTGGAAIRFLSSKGTGLLSARVGNTVTCVGLSRPNGRDFLQIIADDSGTTQVTVLDVSGAEIARLGFGPHSSDNAVG